ncbi:hypothetical protein Tco_1579695, partial [Tanacetum coccineum]
GDNSSDRNTNTFANLKSVNGRNGRGDNISNIDATATLDSPNEADKMKNIKGVVLNDTGSDYEGEDFQGFENVFKSPKLDIHVSLENESSSLKIYVRRTSRKSKLLVKLSDFVLDKKTYDEACKDSIWIDAMNLEMEALNRLELGL